MNNPSDLGSKQVEDIQLVVNEQGTYDSGEYNLMTRLGSSLESSLAEREAAKVKGYNQEHPVLEVILNMILFHRDVARKLLEMFSSRLVEGKPKGKTWEGGGIDSEPELQRLEKRLIEKIWGAEREFEDWLKITQKRRMGLRKKTKFVKIIFSCHSWNACLLWDITFGEEIAMWSLKHYSSAKVLLQDLVKVGHLNLLRTLQVGLR